MEEKAKVLILGSKEFPLDTNNGHDPLPSGGMEALVNCLAPALAKSCDITIITRKFSNALAEDKQGRIKIYRVSYIKGKYFRGPSFNLFSLFHALKIIKEQRIDAILCFGIMSATIGCLCKKILGTPVIAVPCGVGFTQFSCPINIILRALERQIYSKCDSVIFSSAGELAVFESKLTSIKNSWIITPCIKSLSKINKNIARASLKIPARELVICSVSRLVPVKGLSYLIRAAEKIKGYIYIIGKGPEAKNLARLAERIKNVTLTGFVSSEEKLRYLSAADIFVVSSLAEGLPLALLEAMSLGKACIVTDIGLPLINNETGLVVPAKNETALAEAINKLAEDASLRERLGNAAERFVKKRCDASTCAENYITAIQKTIKRKRF